MEDIINKEYTKDELFIMLDTYITKYYKYYNSQNIEDKKDNIKYTKQLHEILTNDCNFIKIALHMGDFIDKHIDATNNIDFVIMALDYLLCDNLFTYLISIDIDIFDDDIKSIYHHNLVILIMYRHLLYTKYVEENIDEFEMKKIFLEVKMPSIIKIVKNIYDNMCLKSQKNDYYVPLKENLMELLCAFDLEEIYVNELLE